MLAEKFKVAGRPVERGGKPYVIAEAGANFNQSLDIAKRLIDAAAEAKADAVKFQLFKARELVSEAAEGFDVLKSVELNPDWVPVLAEHAKSRSLPFLASAFSLDALAVLEAVGVPAHKVASSEVLNLPLLAAMARTGKPIFLSTGMSDLADIALALEVIASEGNDKVSLMHCYARYPLPESEANLRVIETLSRAFGGPVGYSDHTLTRKSSVAAVALGAVTFEKHFTLDKKSEGPDHFFALEPKELADYVSAIHETHAALGDGIKTLHAEEQNGRRREGLHARRKISAGQKLTREDIEVRRPATGIRSRDHVLVLGAAARNTIEAGEPVRWTDIKL